MRLSWNEIRSRAARFAKEWQSAAYEKGETQSFYNDFFAVFGVQRRTVARYEQHVKKLDSSSGYMDLFWPGMLMIEQKSAGRNLSRAHDQAGEYFDALKPHERPRYILLSDFQAFELRDLGERAAHPRLRWLISTIQTSCRPVCARHIEPSTAPWIDCIDAGVLTPSVSGWNTCSTDTRKCASPCW